MRILVTGATGFIGRAVCRDLLHKGFEVVAFVRDIDRARDLEALGAQVEVGTIADPNEIAAAGEDADVFVHTAGISSPKASRRALEWVNVAGTENVLEAAKHLGVARLVHLSCADVTLGNCDRVHWNEDRAPVGEPLDALARSKLLAEELVLTESGTEIDCVALRPAFLWGPGDTTNLPLMVAEAQHGGVRLVGTGRNLRSTTYVEHLTDAIAAAIMSDKAPGHAYYVTDPEFLEAREFFRAVANAIGIAPPRPGLPYGLSYQVAGLGEALGSRSHTRARVARLGRNTRFDCQRAMTDLGWEPRVPFELGLAKLAEWVTTIGGVPRLLEMARPPADDRSIEAQVLAAREA